MLCGAATLSAQDAPVSGADSSASGAVEAANAGEVEAEGFFQILFKGGWVGLLILLSLLALSMTGVYLTIDHVMTIRTSELIPEGLAEQVTGLITQGRVAEAEQFCKQNPSFLSFVLANGLSEMPAGWEAMEKAMEDATAEQAARLFRRIEYFSVIGNIAPMIGLLGTVTGMIFAFQKVATTQGAAGAADLAEGIYQALITTVGGLLVAIPSLGAFAICRNRLDQLVAEVAYTAQHVFTPWKRRKVRAAPVIPVSAVPPVAPPKDAH
jgi:biopolymer transport protein ExbB